MRRVWIAAAWVLIIGAAFTLGVVLARHLDAQAAAILHLQHKLADQAHEIEWLKEDLAAERKAREGTTTLAVACTATTYQLRLRLRRLERAYPVGTR